VADFGITSIGTSTRLQHTEQCRGTEQYLGPEVRSSSHFSKKTDIWSLGCILYELNCGQPAFKSFNDVFEYCHNLRSTPQLPNIPEARDNIGSWLQSPVHSFTTDTEDVYRFLMNEWTASASESPLFQTPVIEEESVLQTILRRTNKILELTLDYTPDNRPSVRNLLEYIVGIWLFCTEIEVLCIIALRPNLFISGLCSKFRLAR
jgi:serine/threonine protein kinase